MKSYVLFSLTNGFSISRIRSFIDENEVILNRMQRESLSIKSFIFPTSDGNIECKIYDNLFMVILQYPSMIKYISEICKSLGSNITHDDVIDQIDQNVSSSNLYKR